MKLIPLTRGLCAIVDDDMYDFLSQFSWYANPSRGGFYAIRNVVTLNGKRIRSRMHHWIAGYPLNGKVVDHINGVTLDNRRTNLRVVSKRENQGNSSSRRAGQTTSRYIGVRWDKNAKKWRSTINIGGRLKHLGLFTNEDQAGIAYQTALEDLI